MVYRTARGGSGRRPPQKIDDFAKLDRFAAELSLELLKRMHRTYGSTSGFLRMRMQDPSAPRCIQGDPDDRKSFDDAKRAMTARTGVPASVIAEWDLVEYILVHCLPMDETDRAIRPRLAGLWLASQRYEPPGYHGPVEVPADAPVPITDLAEAPNDAVRVQILRKQLSETQDKVAQLEHELEHRNECEKMVIEVVAHQQRQLDLAASNPATRDLLAQNVKLHRQLDEVRGWYSQRERRIRGELMAKLQYEQAAHNLTANRMAATIAMFDAMRDYGVTDPARWMRRADVPLGMDLHTLFNHPGSVGTSRSGPSCPPSGESDHVVQRRFLAVYLRSYLITLFGHVPDRADDPTGLYRVIVRDGVLPPMDVLREALSTHSLTLQFVRPLMDILAEEKSSATVSEIAPRPGPDHHPLREMSADVHPLDALRGGGHRAGALESPVSALDLISALTQARRPGNSA